MMNGPAWVVLAALILSAGAVTLAAAANRITRRANVRAAEHRWRTINAQARAAGCKCGRPATVVVRDYGTTGSVPHETWTCDEHQGVATWQGIGHEDRTITWTPMWGHPVPCPLGETTGAMGKIDQEPDTFHCPHRTHETQVTS